MNFRKILPYCFFFLLISSCKDKDPEVDKCKNGYLDAGEEAIDCGGVCPPCPEEKNPYMIVRVNGKPLQITNKGIDYNGGFWLVHGSKKDADDDVTFQFNFGNNGTVGNSPIIAENSGGYMGTSILKFISGNAAISSHDTENKLMSGYFSAIMIRGEIDTILFEGGQFEYLPY